MDLFCLTEDNKKRQKGRLTSYGVSPRERESTMGRNSIHILSLPRPGAGKSRAGSCIRSFSDYFTFTILEIGGTDLGGGIFDFSLARLRP
jgi:hypothetical protein